MRMLVPYSRLNSASQRAAPSLPRRVLLLQARLSSVSPAARAASSRRLTSTEWPAGAPDAAAAVGAAAGPPAPPILGVEAAVAPLAGRALPVVGLGAWQPASARASTIAQIE